MKNNQNNMFSIPTKQSYIAILLMLGKIYQRFIKTFWYLLLPIFLKKGDVSSYYLYIILGIAIVLAIYAIISFFKYKFHLEEGEFIVEKGVFSKKRIVIPFDRIQSINFKQNIIHQLFDVVSLEIDTAGTSKKEFDFDALNIAKSNELRDYIFAYKKENDIHQTVNNPDYLQESSFTPPQQQAHQKTIQLDFFDLIKIGLTQNHFRSLIVALFSIFWLLDQVEKLGLDLSMLEDVSEEDILQLSLYMLGSLFVVAILAIIIVSVFRTILRYYNFLMLRIPLGFKLEYGLFNRNEISVMDNKMQVMIWSDNLLRKLLGLHTLQIKLASSQQVKSKKSIIIPGVTNQDITQIKEFYYPKNSSNLIQFEQSNIYYLYRRLFVFASIFILISILLFYLAPSPFYFIPLGLLCYFILTTSLRYKKMKYGINHEVIQLNTGIFGDKKLLLFLHKLQGVNIQQSFIQNRKNLADVVLYTAAGSHRIRYINKEKARQIRDYVIYRIESDVRDWI